MLSPQRRRDAEETKCKRHFSASLRLCGGLIFAVSLHAEIIDQVAATVDNQVITRSQIVEQVRVAAFLNGEKPDSSPANLRRTADRLIELTLVAREMDLTRYPQPTLADIKDLLAQVRGRYPSDAAYRAALAGNHITPAQLEESLRQQAALLRFIDLRFRPEVQVQDTDVERYCENVYLPEQRKKPGSADLTLQQAMPQCEEDFTGQLVDTRLDTWLKETRGRSRITYEEDAFQ